MERLKMLLYNAFVSELINLNIGYEFNDTNIARMMNLVNILDYIERSGASSDEVISILQHYE